MVRQFNFPGIISLLRANALVSGIEKPTIDEIAKRGFYKIKCHLFPSKFKLDIKFIKTPNEFKYSYQLYTSGSIVRWDNQPHYPHISTFPNHFHNLDGTVGESDLTGNAEEDLKIVLLKIKSIIEDSHL
jgi:hypothetical protein